MDSDNSQGPAFGKRQDDSDAANLFKDDSDDQDFTKLKRRQRKPQEDSTRHKKISKDKTSIHKGDTKIKKRVKLFKPEKVTENDKEQQLDQLCKKKAEELLKQMKSKADHDIRRRMAGKSSTYKLQFLGTLNRVLGTRATAEYFLQGDGLVLFQRWLRKYPDGTEPSYALKKECFQILRSLPIGAQHVSKCQTLLSLIQKHQSCSQRELKQLAQSITFKWKYMLADNDDIERDD